MKRLVLLLPLLLAACSSATRTVYEYDATATQQSNQLTAILLVTFVVCTTLCVLAFVIADYLQKRPRP